jgi:hypothetical protein
MIKERLVQEDPLTVEDFRTLHVKTIQDEDCKNGVCMVKHKFHWKGSGKCLATFKCNQLGVNVCKDFGLEVIFPNESKQKAVCIEGSLVLGTLQVNQTAEVDIWYKEDMANSTKANCYLWCANKPMHLVHQQSQNSIIQVLARYTINICA